MVVIRLRGVKQVRAKGRLYYYHRATMTRLPDDPQSREFLDMLDRLNRRDRSGDLAPAPGTLGALITAYRMSPEFVTLAPVTKADYQKVFDHLAKLRDMPVDEIDKPFVYEIRDAAFNARKRRFSTYVLQVMSRLFSWGEPRGYASGNPAAKVEKIRRPRNARDVNRPWTEDEIAAVLGGAPPELRLPIAIGLYTGLREGDVLRVTWSAYDGQRFESRQGKTGEPIWIPAHASLRAILDEAAKSKESPVIVLGARKKPFTESGFRARFFKLIRRLKDAGAIGDGLTFHGLRHTVATMLADAGCDTRDIMAITGHKTEAMAAKYTQKADQQRRARAAVAKLESYRKGSDS